MKPVPLCHVWEYNDVDRAFWAEHLEGWLPRRILYGSDNPIFFMRGRRQYKDRTYINRTNYPFHFNREREAAEIEARYTLMMYEDIKAIKEACGARGSVRGVRRPVPAACFAAARSPVTYTSGRRLMEGGCPQPPFLGAAHAAAVTWSAAGRGRCRTRRRRCCDR